MIQPLTGLHLWKRCNPVSSPNRPFGGFRQKTASGSHVSLLDSRISVKSGNLAKYAVYSINCIFRINHSGIAVLYCKTAFPELCVFRERNACFAQMQKKKATELKPSK